MTVGRFISLEGGEGVGKSTQARLVAEWLGSLGIDVVLTREPGGSEGGEAIRQLLLAGDADRWSGRAEALLFAAARSDHVDRVIWPALARGAWVICDRFVDSSRAYQSADGLLTDSQIKALHSFGSEGFLPDRTVLFALSPDQAVARAHSRDGGAGDRIGARNAAFHKAVHAAFGRFAAEEPERFRVIAAEGGIADVHAAVKAALSDLLP